MSITAKLDETQQLSATFAEEKSITASLFQYGGSGGTSLTVYVHIHAIWKWK